MDISSKKVMCRFVPMHGVSYLSLSPFDTTLAIASSSGDAVYLYDLAFLPNQITAIGRFIRGKLPGVVKSIIWGQNGCDFGVLTAKKGSLHWFDAHASISSSFSLSNFATSTPSASSPNQEATSPGQFSPDPSLSNGSESLGNKKIWTMSGWNIHEAVIAGTRSAPSLLLTLQSATEGVKIVVADCKTGTAGWQFVMLSEIDTNEIHSTPRPDRSKGGDPLANYELNSCKPFAFIHTDRRFTICTSLESQYPSDMDWPVPKLIGAPIDTLTVDFGKANGGVSFENKDSEEDTKELLKAMEAVNFGGFDAVSIDEYSVPGDDDFAPVDEDFGVQAIDNHPEKESNGEHANGQSVN